MCHFSRLLLLTTALMAPLCKKKVRESKGVGVHVQGLTRSACGSDDEALACLDLGTQQRTTAATLFNTESSRSHAVFELSAACRCEKNRRSGCFS